MPGKASSPLDAPPIKSTPSDSQNDEPMIHRCPVPGITQEFLSFPPEEFLRAIEPGPSLVYLELSTVGPAAPSVGPFLPSVGLSAVTVRLPARRVGPLIAASFSRSRP